MFVCVDRGQSLNFGVLERRRLSSPFPLYCTTRLPYHIILGSKVLTAFKFAISIFNATAVGKTCIITRISAKLCRHQFLCVSAELCLCQFIFVVTCVRRSTFLDHPEN